MSKLYSFTHKSIYILCKYALAQMVFYCTKLCYCTMLYFEVHTLISVLNLSLFNYPSNTVTAAIVNSCDSRVVSSEPYPTLTKRTVKNKT